MKHNINGSVALTICLHRSAKGGRENPVVLCQVWLRPPFVPGEAAREADAKGRAASPRGCTRLRRKPLAGEPRG